ncbi:hypothetical protein niasHS_007588 [Heterodera schachtii]|uniref:Uncharacterized protein n=1 Tax=Heterodera schachtii TaxID=97005 RepID=A0ABD2JPG4_HETSC
MLGVVFLSEYNELIHAFGNDEFRDRFTSIAASKSANDALNEFDTTTAPETVRPTSSLSSSGISSSTSTTCSSPAATENDKKRGKGNERKERKNEERRDFLREKNGAEDGRSPQLDESLLLQQLMPLVLLCRAKQSQQKGHNAKGTSSSLHENIESIFCPKSLLHIRICCLPHGNLLALIHGQSPVASSPFVDCLFPSLLRCVRYHYGGPSLQLIPLRSAFVRQLNVRCERRMLRILSGTQTDDAVDDSPFCQNANFGVPSRFIRQSLLPLFKELSRQFSALIGRRCRCLFLHSNRLIASVSSHKGERTAAAFCHDDLCSLLQFARQSPPLFDAEEQQQQQSTDKTKDATRKSSTEKEQAEERGRKSHAELGIWLYSKSLRRRQLHNIFVFSLNERIEMICVAPTEHSQLISTVWEALDSVDKLTDISTEHLSPFSNSNVPLLLERCDRLLANEQKLLDCLANNGTAERNKMQMTTDFLGVNDQKMAQQFPFLENVPRTQRLIMHHWNKLRESINSAFSSAHPQAVRPPPSIVVDRLSPNHRAPLSLLSPFSRLRSPVAAFARPSVFVPRLVSRCASNNQCTVSSASSTVAPPLTHSSAAFSSSSFSVSRVSSTFLDAMRSQLRRVQRSLLDELLGWNAFRARAQILSSLQLVLHRSMDAQIAAALARFDAELCATASGTLCRNALKPTILGFDMIAYKCVRVGSPSLSLHYVPEETTDAKQMLNKLMFMDDLDTEDEPSHDDGEEIDGQNAEEITFARTCEGELLIRLCNPNNISTSSTCFNESSRPSQTVQACVPFALPSSLLAALAAPLTSRLGKVSRDFLSGQSANSSPASYHCTVLFSQHTNTSLAIRQTSALITALRTEMEKSLVPNFN